MAGLFRRAMVLVLVMLICLGNTVHAQTDADDRTVFPTPGEDDDRSDELDELPAQLDNSTYPFGGPALNLAAITLDDADMPADYRGWGELHFSADRAEDWFAALITADELNDVGFTGYYLSSYINDNDDILSTWVISFETEDDVQDGFDLFEDDEAMHPNGSFADGDPLADVGEAPAETTTGMTSVGDGTEERYYTVTFRVANLLLSAEMRTSDGDDPDQELVDELADVLWERAEAAVRGDDIPGIVDELPMLLVYPDREVFYDGYQSETESYTLSTMENVPRGFVSAYETIYSLTNRTSSFVPYLNAGIVEFRSPRALDDAFDDPESLIVTFDDLEQLDDIELRDADASAVFTFSIGDDDEIDSVRVYAQIGNRMIVIDVQEHPDIDQAVDIAVGFAEGILACMTSGECEPPDVGITD